MHVNGLAVIYVVTLLFNSLTALTVLFVFILFILYHGKTITRVRYAKGGSSPSLEKRNNIIECICIYIYISTYN